jgi:hypothetical protein
MFRNMNVLGQFASPAECNNYEQNSIFNFFFLISTMTKSICQIAQLKTYL